MDIRIVFNGSTSYLLVPFGPLPKGNTEQGDKAPVDDLCNHGASQQRDVVESKNTVDYKANAKEPDEDHRGFFTEILFQKSHLL